MADVALRDAIAQAIGESLHPGARTWWTGAPHASREQMERAADAVLGLVEEWIASERVNADAAYERGVRDRDVALAVERRLAEEAP